MAMRQEFSEGLFPQESSGESFEPLSAGRERLQAQGSASNSSGVSNQHSNLHIKGLPAHTDEAMLLQLFSPFGQVQSARVFTSSAVRSWTRMVPPVACIRGGSDLSRSA